MGVPFDCLCGSEVSGRLYMVRSVLSGLTVLAPLLEMSRQDRWGKARQLGRLGQAGVYQSAYQGLESAGIGVVETRPDCIPNT